jgi:glycosyltransferase involved in cell wall biosynthesis
MTLDIALPFYGDVGYLKQTVESVLAQTDPDWRLIVVDDGYPDESIPGWFESLGDSRITYQRNPGNLGANGNYRKCIDQIEAEYCLIMGADDILEINYVEQMKYLVTKYPEAAMFHPGVQVIDEFGKIVFPISDRIKRRIRSKLGDKSSLSGESVAKSLMDGNWLYFPSIIWKTKVIQETGFRIGLHVCQDLALAIDVLKKGNSIAVTDEVLFQYRRHLSSDSSTKALTGERFDEERRFFSELASEFAEIGWHAAAKSAKIHFSSRLHALLLVPKAIVKLKNPLPVLRHVFLNS